MKTFRELAEEQRITEMANPISVAKAILKTNIENVKVDKKSKNILIKLTHLLNKFSLNDFIVKFSKRINQDFSKLISLDTKQDTIIISM